MLNKILPFKHMYEKLYLICRWEINRLLTNLTETYPPKFKFSQEKPDKWATKTFKVSNLR